MSYFLFKRYKILLITWTCLLWNHSVLARENVDSTLNELKVWMQKGYLQEVNTQLIRLSDQMNELRPSEQVKYYYLSSIIQKSWTNLQASYYLIEKGKLIAEREKETEWLLDIYIHELLILDQLERLNIIKPQKERKKDIMIKFNSYWSSHFKGTAMDYTTRGIYYYFKRNMQDSAIHYFDRAIDKITKEPSRYFPGYTNNCFVFKSMTLAKQLKPSSPLDEINRSVQPLYQALGMMNQKDTTAWHPAYIHTQIAKIFTDNNRYDSIIQHASILDTLLKKEHNNNPFYLGIRINTELLKLYYYNQKGNKELAKSALTESQSKAIDYYKLALRANNGIIQLIMDMEESDRKQIINRNTIITLIITLLSCMIFLLYIYMHKRKKEFLLKEKQQQNEKLLKQAEIDKISALLTGREQERKSIAQELHDEIASAIAGINLKLETIHVTAENSLRVIRLKDIQSKLTFLYNKVRNISHVMSMSYSIKGSLLDLLYNLFNEYESTNLLKINYSFFPEHAIDSLPEFYNKHIFLLFQEMLLNTKKHAHATEINICMNLFKNDLTIIFEDNGIGIPEKSILSELSSLKTRTQLIHGKLHIESTPGKNTIITINVSIEEKGIHAL